jgi:hypothetical protein
MMPSVAYLDQAEVKKSALKHASLPGSAGWAVEDSDEQRHACAARFGLSESLLNLVSHAFHVPYGTAALQKLSTSLAAIEPGADTLALVRAWVRGIWEAEVWPHVIGSAAEQAALELMRLVEATALEQVPRDALRRARKTVSAFAGADPKLDHILELLIAMGWDLAVSPRATTDIWNTWEATVTVPVNRAAGWEQHLQDEVFDAVRNAHIAVYEKVGASPKDQGKASAMLNAELAAQGYATRFEELKAHLESTLLPAMKQWRERAEQSIFEACSASAPPENQT